MERLILAKLFFFNKNDFVKINQNPPPGGGGLWLILAKGKTAVYCGFN